jgi:hypothetical protein
LNNIAALLDDFARPGRSESTEFADIITFCESPWGLNTKLWPSQRFLLKLFYGVELSKEKPDVVIDGKSYKGIPVYDMFMTNCMYQLSEVEFLKYLHDEGRCNVKEQSDQFTELVMAIGRRGSKSAMTAMMATYEIYKLLSRHSPNEYYNMLDVGLISITAVATSANQAAGLYKVARGYISKCRFFNPYVVSDTEDRMTFRTQADIESFGPKAKPTIEILFRPAIGRGLRGPANIVCIFDEFAHFLAEGQSSAEETYDAATPSTATFKSPKTMAPEGRVISISSPLNRTGKFYELFTKGMEGQADGRLCIQAPSWEFNPTISSQYLRKKYKDDPAKFLCEFGAQFSDRFSGWIRRDQDLLQCVVPELRPKKTTYIRRPHFMGVDVGLTYDGTAIAVTHIDGEHIELDYSEVRYAGQGPYESMDQLDFDSIADWIADVAKKFNIYAGFFDEHMGKPLEQALKRRGFNQFRMEYSSRDKSSKMYSSAKLLMMDKKLRLYDWPIPEGEDHSPLISELLELQEQRVSKHLSVVAAPNVPGKHDDLSDALIRSIWLAQEHMGDQKFVQVASKYGQVEGLKHPGKYRTMKSYKAQKVRRNNYKRQRGS